VPAPALLACSIGMSTRVRLIPLEGNGTNGSRALCWLSAHTRNVKPGFHAAPDAACGSVAITARTATVPEIGAAPDATLHASLRRSAEVPVAPGVWPQLV